MGFKWLFSTLAQQSLVNILLNNMIQENFALTSSLLSSKQEAKFHVNWVVTLLYWDSF